MRRETPFTDPYDVKMFKHALARGKVVVSLTHPDGVTLRHTATLISWMGSRARIEFASGSRRTVRRADVLRIVGATHEDSSDNGCGDDGTDPAG